MREKVYLLRDPKRLRKFCQRRNKDYRCADIFGCNIVCPLAHLRETEYQMNLKNLELGDAYRMFERSPISKEEGKQIIQDKLKEAQAEKGKEERCRAIQEAEERIHARERAKEWKDDLHYKPPEQKNFKQRGDIENNPQSHQEE